MILLSKKLTPLLIASLWLLSWWGTALSANSQPEKAILLTKQRPVYQLVLPSNPSTGYRWYLIAYDDQFLTLVKHDYHQPNGHQLGASGEDKWVFRANSSAFKAPMLLNVQLIYARPWDIANGHNKIIHFVTKQ